MVNLYSMKRVGLLLFNLLFIFALFFFVSPKPQSIEAALPTCSSLGGSCGLPCADYSPDKCSVAGSCSSGTCCKTCAATNTPQPTATETPIPNNCIADSVCKTRVCSYYGLRDGSKTCDGHCCRPQPTNTPTATPIPNNCILNNVCKVHVCSYYDGWEDGSKTCDGYCCHLKPTSTPTPTPTPPCSLIRTQECKDLECYEYPYMTDGVGGCDNDRFCCKPRPPTNTPIYTPTPTPSPTPGCGDQGQRCCEGNTCSNGTIQGRGDLYCTGSQCLYGDEILRCLVIPTTAPNYVNKLEYCRSCWGPPDTCHAPNNCNLWTFSAYCPSGYVCADDGINCAETNYTGQYCLQQCDILSCGTGLSNDKLKCWPSYADYEQNQDVFTLGPCIYIPACVDDNCVARWETCGGSVLQATCDSLYPGLGYVPHIDSCGGQDCGPPCNPTPTGDPGEDCTPDCTGAEDVCIGETFPAVNDCGTCNGEKNCTGTLYARSVLVTASDTSCAALTASTNSLNGTVFSFSPAVNPASKTQTSSAGVSWTDVVTDGTVSYRVNATPQYALTQANVCASINGGAYTQRSAAVLPDEGTLHFIVGYLPQAGWVQTTGGNVYTTNTLKSSIPSSATNPYFSLAGAIGSAGMISYGSTYDFSLATANLGETMVSTDNWLVEHTNSAVDFYTQLASRMDIPNSATVLTTLTNITKPTCTTSPCIFYADGNLTTSTTSSWSIPADEQIIIFASGNVTINRPITITSGGFFAIVAHGNITVSSAIGTAVGTATPRLEGIYIATNAGHTATFSTSASQAGTERLVIQGSVIADTFQLLRDLDITNATTPSEQFIFDPQLLFTMPDTMKEIPYIWQEVAP